MIQSIHQNSVPLITKQVHRETLQPKEPEKVDVLHRERSNSVQGTYSKYTHKTDYSENHLRRDDNSDLRFSAQKAISELQSIEHIASPTNVELFGIDFYA